MEPNNSHPRPSNGRKGSVTSTHSRPSSALKMPSMRGAATPAGEGSANLVADKPCSRRDSSCNPQAEAELNQWNDALHDDFTVPLNQSFNRASYRVNTGLPFNASPPALPPSITSLDFSLTTISLTFTPSSPPTLQSRIQILLHPPAHAFQHGVLTLNWAISVLGMQEFEQRGDGDGRWVLKRDSEVRVRGREMSIPAMLWEWLCRVEVGGCWLTREFFEKEV